LSQTTGAKAIYAEVRDTASETVKKESLEDAKHRWLLLKTRVERALTMAR
jgi:hypothetical protein